MHRYMISVCGPNGAGKSTFTKSVISGYNLPIVDPDMYSSQGISEMAAGRLAIRLINAYLLQGISFIRESTLTSRFDLAKFRQAEELGYKNVLIYLFLPSVEDSLLRVERRVEAGGHNIPREAVLRRFCKSLANLELVRESMDFCCILNAGIEYSVQGEFHRLEEFMKNAFPKSS